MKYCPWCGGSVIDGAAFCVECGKSLPSASQRPETSASGEVFVNQPDGVPYVTDKAAQPFTPQDDADDTLPDEWEDDTEPCANDYYDDIPADQQTIIREGPDRKLILRVAILGCAAAVILIFGIVAALYL